jgi:Tol biopolymer transport system component
VQRLTLALVALASVAFLPGAAEAVIPGPNGPIAFTSGRDDGGTAFTSMKAQVWMLNAPGGAAIRLSSGFDDFHHRHPTWSPDRTKVAYARCQLSSATCNFSGPWDIYVQDLLNGGTPVNITPGGESEDRPAWSPDGTRIAYTKNTSGTNWDIKVRPATGGAETTVATAVSNEAGGWKQTRAQWTPDSTALIYGDEFQNTPADYDIRRAAADGSSAAATTADAGTPINVSTSNDYQPAVSPGGSTICFTDDTAMAPNFKDVYTEPSGGGPVSPVATTTGDDFECDWSPDGRKIAFGRGGFDNGQILMKNADGTGSETSVTNDAGNNRFDGNTDWAPNPQPSCTSRAVPSPFNRPVSIPLACTDARDPPSFTAPQISPVIATGPAHGALSGSASSGSIGYTPAANFAGSDSFTYTGSDGNSTSEPATVTINVGAIPPGKASFKGTKSTIRVDRKGRFKFTFHATPGLTGKAVFESTKKIPVTKGAVSRKPRRKRRVTLARKSFKVPASGKVALKLKLSRKNLRILKLNRKIRTRVKVTLKNPLGLTSTASRKITLKAPKRARRPR